MCIVVGGGGLRANSPRIAASPKYLSVAMVALGRA